MLEFVVWVAMPTEFVFTLDPFGRADNVIPHVNGLEHDVVCVDFESSGFSPIHNAVAHSFISQPWICVMVN